MHAEGQSWRTAMLLAVAMIALPLSAARAQDDAPEEPWEQGVAAASRERALALFQQGNALFTQSEYRGAAARYREALGFWDHPRIHGNLATALIYLDDPLGAIEHIEKALRYGAAPFERHVYEQLLTNRKLLLGQLARIEVDCDDTGVAITLDGKELEAASSSSLAIAGRHQVVGRKPGYLTFTRDFTAVGGRTTIIRVEVVPLAEATRYERRWPVWRPWAVVGAGVAVAALGIPLHRAALSARDEYEREIGRECPTGCETADISPAIQDLESRSRTYNTLELSAYALGGAIAATGGVLLYLNRQRLVERGRAGSPVVAFPAVSTGQIGLAVETAF